jgi:hypothetical protein
MICQTVGREPGRGSEVHDLRAASDLGEFGWHGQDHVLAQQRGQGIDVATVRRVDDASPGLGAAG